MWAKLGRWYAMTGVLVLNTLLCVLALNAGVWLYGQVDDDAMTLPQPTPQAEGLRRFAAYEGSLFNQWDALRAAHSHLSDFEITRLGYEHTLLTLACDDARIYRTQALGGQFITVDAAGFRHIDGQAPWPPPPDVQTVYMFGGSTTFGWMVDNASTVASWMQHHLRDDANTDPIAVYNFGVVGYVSLQERWFLEELVAAGHAPDVAVFLDGLNDLAFYETRVALSANNRCQDVTIDTAARIVNLLSCDYDELCWPIQRLATARDAQRDDDDQNAYFDFVRERTGLDFIEPPLPVDSLDAWRDALARWQANRRAIDELGTQAGFRALYVIQPTASTTPSLTEAQFTFPDDERSIFARPGVAYPLWLEALGDDPAVLNLADLPPQTDQVSYVTPSHYARDYAGHIAARIAAALLERDYVR